MPAKKTSPAVAEALHADGPEAGAAPVAAPAKKAAVPKPAKRAHGKSEPAKKAAPKKEAAKKASKKKPAKAKAPREEGAEPDADFDPDLIRVRRMHRRDINRVWEFLKRVFRDVNQKTVEYQRPRSKRRFEESYDDEGIDQLVFEHQGEVVGYAESTFETTGSDNWINWRWFDARDMRPLFVEELAVHPDYQGRGVGSYMLEQLRHIASLRGCTHLVLEVAENNEDAMRFYRKRNFHKIDASIFLAHRLDRQPELLPPRSLKPARHEDETRAIKAARAAKAVKASRLPKALLAVETGARPSEGRRRSRKAGES